MSQNDNKDVGSFIIRPIYAECSKQIVLIRKCFIMTSMSIVNIRFFGSMWVYFICFVPVKFVRLKQSTSSPVFIFFHLLTGIWPHYCLFKAEKKTRKTKEEKGYMKLLKYYYSILFTNKKHHNIVSLRVLQYRFSLRSSITKYLFNVITLYLFYSL